MEFIMSLLTSIIQKLIDCQRDRPANRLKRLEKRACRLHQEITGCKLEKSERFTNCQLVDIFYRQPKTAIERTLTGSQAKEPYYRILYWLWYYSVLA